MSKWEKIKLDNLCNKKINTLSSKDNYIINYIDISSIDTQQKMIVSYQTMSSKEAPSRAKQILEKNDVLVSTVRPNLNAVAVNRVESENTVIGSTGFCVLRCSNKIDVNYLFNFSRSRTFINELVKLAKGASYPAVSNSQVRNINIPLPPLETQKQIAKTLDTATELLAMRKQQLEELNELIKSVFYDMFGDPVANEKGWEVFSIVDVCIEIVDCVNKTAPVIDGVSPYKMIRTTNIKKGYVDTQNVKYVDEHTFEKWTRRSIPKKGDILLTREAPIGEVGMIDSDDFLFLGQRIVSYRVNKSKMNPLYLLNLIQSEYFQQQIFRLARGSTVKHLSVPECSLFQVLVPPLELQNQFADIVTKIEEQKTLVKQAIDETQQLFDSLMSEYFDD